MSKKKSCQPQLLAQSPLAQVFHCPECGCVSVNIGPFTVRLDQDGLEDLWAVLGKALNELHTQKQLQWPTPAAEAS